ncbi:MAG: C4-dicarboxylate transporter DcuC [Desulfovibrio sp.]|jgi:DcuC family C4-dicarboxylate transporter|nr:C4-dicarboxylate transporter DcuC [Desulfovibrio sp.]
MSGTIAIIFGMVVLAAAVFFLIRQVETRLVLLAAGFTMAVAALAPLNAFDAFSKSMISGVLIQNICSTLGFAMILQITECDKHLIYGLTRGLSRVRFIIIPGAALATFCINIALPSAAGCAASVGVIFIPLLISQGISPAVAASAVMLGTFGSMLSPGLMHNPIIAKLAGMEVMEAIKGHAAATVASIIVGAISLAVVAYLRKEDRNFTNGDQENCAGRDFRVNPLLAALPLIPIAVLIVFSLSSVRASVSWAASIKVPHAMLLGAFLCLLFTRTNPQTAVKKFFEGMGKGYGDVLGIIIATGVFVSGMQALGMIEAFISLLKNSQGIAKLAATYGPFLLGVVSGSGDSAAIAFNESVTPHAQNFGMTISNMGSMAALAGALGRTMSPLAGAAIICAGIAKVSPFELSRRLAPGMIIASMVSLFILM